MSIRRYSPVRQTVGVVVGLVCLGLVVGENNPAYGGEDALSRSLEISAQNSRKARRSQIHIDHLDDETRMMLEEYRKINRALDSLKIYNDQLARMLVSQKQEISSIGKQLDDIEVTQREIVPLIIRMVEWLAELVELDHPFLPEERQGRVHLMRSMLDRADVSTGEKYRRVLEAYQVETEYARTIESYQGELLDNGESRSVVFLRMGRIELYYQTLDESESGWWDRVNNRWQVLPERFNKPISHGLRLARKQAVPALLRLPIHAPKEGGS
ncbi:MAG: DUF3450 domain-containing protein [Magnetococcales bacterium]|nr:DUF3450 domain-containing protein [Magnetococcales bacterium]